MPGAFNRSFTVFTLFTLKVKECIAIYGNSITQLRSVTCRMGSHSVTCHPTQANTPRYLAVDLLQNVSNVSDRQIRVKHKLESRRRLIEVEFVLAGPEAEQPVSPVTIATNNSSLTLSYMHIHTDTLEYSLCK